MINILLIGCGYHAKRIYAPHLNDFDNAKVVAVYDLLSQKATIESYWKEKKFKDTNFFYSNNCKISDKLLKKEVDDLNRIVKNNKINAVVISTEPLAHFKYTKWALDNDLHILLDKPITTEIEVSTNPKKSKKLYSDYLKIKQSYLSKLKKKNLVFILQAQRRHHNGFVKTKDLILEISKKTNCPVTSINAFHSDGQWRFPKEIVEQDYHPYNQGYGKMSHSGYHSLDTAIWFAQSSILDANKKFNNFEVFAQATRPKDVLFQLNYDDYKNLFSDFGSKNIVSQELTDKTTGEIDAHSLISLLHNKFSITNISTHAVHNGFSQRNWISTEGRDLYKGNGRIRHESYIIEQGPFQCIIVNSFQSAEILKGNIEPHSTGGEYHYDIHVFRNNTLFSEFNAYELITMKSLNEIKDLNYSRGHQEDARRNCIEEFISAITNKTNVSNQVSNFLDHELSTHLLSSIYLSISSKKVIKDKISYL